MEFRKVIGFGKSSFVVSLPKSWVEKNNLKKGDLIGLSQEKNHLTLSPNESSEKPISEINLNLGGLDRTSVLYYIRSAYRKGYEVINVKFDDQTCTHFRTKEDKNVLSVIHEEVNRLVGVEIIQQKKDMCIIKSISEPSFKDFDTILRRIFLLLNDITLDLVQGVETNNKILIETIEEKHNTISKFASYCLRTLNQKGYQNPENSYFLYHIIATLDKITDTIKYCARSISNIKNKFNKESIMILKGISDSIRMYNELFYKFDIKKVIDLSENRDDVKNRIKELSNKKIPYSEMLILNDMKGILELLLDLTEARISMNG